MEVGARESAPLCSRLRPENLRDGTHGGCFKGQRAEMKSGSAAGRQRECRSPGVLSEGSGGPGSQATPSSWALFSPLGGAAPPPVILASL